MTDTPTPKDVQDSKTKVKEDPKQTWIRRLDGERVTSEDYARDGEPEA